MNNYSLPIYDDCRGWIRKRREQKSWSWDKLLLAGKDSEEKLKKFLDTKAEDDDWEINIEDWEIIVKQMKDSEEKSEIVEKMNDQALIKDETQDNALSIPYDPKSSWVLYKNRLLGQGFKKEVVANIEDSTYKTLKRLSLDTTNRTNPIKGLVVGNVQSGKTANMAALMAMSADWGWNFFVVLSGTIENLRVQTEKRLHSDLQLNGNLNWRFNTHLSTKSELGDRIQSLNLSDTSMQRFITVCLKNSSRLKKLVQWMQEDPKKQQQLKVLVIDDEADQAGINTSDISSDERTTINKLITSLVNGKNYLGEDINKKYKAMNYIGYTATPYASILNEMAEESLYPHSFIYCLKNSNEYFGPQQIFGVDGREYNGIDMINIISEDEKNEIKEIHSDDYEEFKNIPTGLRKAIDWFLCATSVMRYNKYKKPISMLVHTSQYQSCHNNIANIIRNYLDNTDKKIIIANCQSIYTEQKEKLSKEKFFQEYPNYGTNEQDVNDYPYFMEIREELVELISQVSHIRLGDEGKMKYHKGVHLCIDNCSRKSNSDDSIYVRLAYPENIDEVEKAPAFIVVGGATLSRGLTIEGLISTYFLRSVGQSDTLMQMGRWFGYRKGYELLPRIWVTEKTNKQFKFLASLDEELREEIKRMENTGQSPSKYGIRIKNTPMNSFIKITAKNRMQNAIETDIDYSGILRQTFLFKKDIESLQKNINVVEKLLKEMGNNYNVESKKNNYACVWRNVEFNKIRNMLINYKYYERDNLYVTIKSICKWIEENTLNNVLGNWNVAVAGIKNAKNGTWKLPNGIEVNKVSRTQKIKNDKDCINIGVLRNPADMFVDIDETILPQKTARIIKELLSSNGSKGISANNQSIREMAGFNKTPLLLLYRIDKNSKVSNNKQIRKDMDSKEDLIGWCIYLPGGDGKIRSNSLTVKLKTETIFDDEGDLS